MSTHTSFNIGDRVMLDPPVPAFHAMTHGIVVYYQRRHNPAEPRVRWATGWAVTSKANELRPLTPEEARTLPIPDRILADVDH